MFAFELESEAVLIRDTTRAFASDVLRPALREHEQHGLTAQDYERYRSLGLSDLTWSTRQAERGSYYFLRVLAFEELAWGDVASLLALENTVWVAPVLEALPGGDASFLTRDLLEHPTRRVVAVDGEPYLVQVAEKRFTGDLPFVPARSFDWLLVRHGDALALFRGAKLQIHATVACGLEAAGASSVKLEGTPAWWLSCSAPLAEVTWAAARTVLAAMLVGVARASHEYALRYACERIVFGRPVAQHQAPAFTLAEMRIAIEAARLATWAAAKALDDGDRDAPRRAAQAYLEAAECALFCTREAVQLLGGHGFLQDHPVEKWMRDARALALLCGGRDAAVEDLTTWEGVTISESVQRTGAQTNNVRKE